MLVVSLGRGIGAFGGVHGRVSGTVWGLLGVSSSPRVGLKREGFVGICWFWGLVWKDFGGCCGFGMWGVSNFGGLKDLSLLETFKVLEI